MSVKIGGSDLQDVFVGASSGKTNIDKIIVGNADGTGTVVWSRSTEPEYIKIVLNVDDNTTTATDSGVITLSSGGTWNIDWGDGTVQSGLTQTNLPSHVYSDAGEYTVTMTGSITAISASSSYPFVKALTGNALVESFVSNLSTLTTIGENCFRECAYLATVDIPASVSTIGERCFRDCDLLESFTSRNPSVPTANNSSFSTAGSGTLYVPSGSVSAYGYSPGWSKFKYIQAIA